MLSGVLGAVGAALGKHKGGAGRSKNSGDGGVSLGAMPSGHFWCRCLVP